MHSRDRGNPALVKNSGFKDLGGSQMLGVPF